MWVIAQYCRAGLTPEEILAHHPQVTLSRIFNALGYADDNRDEIDADIAANTPPAEVAFASS